jgi:S-DNA-T family DNA segregation ATPase FtsK/SpoIIIE
VRLLLRLDDGAGTSHDLELVVAPDVKVGELADHLAARLDRPDGLTLAMTRHSGRHVDVDPDEHADAALVLARESTVAASGPRSGASVRLVPATADSTAPATFSPVHLVPVGDTGAARQLPYGQVDHEGVRVVVGERVELCATGDATASVGGVAIIGSRWLSDGDLVTVGDRTVLVQVRGELRPPCATGPTLAHRPAVAHHLLTPATVVDLPAPPGAMRVPGLPLLSALVPLGMGVALWVATQSAATAAFVLFSVVFVLAAGIEARREVRAEHRFQVAEFVDELDEVCDQVDRSHRAERRRAEHAAPSAEGLAAIVHGTRLWERQVGSDVGGRTPSADRATRADRTAVEPAGPLEVGALTVRLGRHAAVPALVVRPPQHGRRDLRRQAQQAASERSTLELPCTLDLDRSRGLALIGPDEHTTAIARSIVLQLVTLVAPDELALDVQCAASRRPSWSWAAWLPHAQSGAHVPRTLVVADSADDHAVSEALARHGPGARLLWIGSDATRRPRGLDPWLALSDGPNPTARLVRVRSDDPGHPVGGDPGSTRPLRSLDSVDARRALQLARSLAGRHVERPTVHLDPVGRASSPDRIVAGPERDHAPVVGLTEVVSADLATAILTGTAEAVSAAWATSDGSAGLGAPIGVAGRGIWHLDLHTDGPHALIAGTTGAGKSELLRTAVASMALHHRPQRLTFLLVDYKGGAAFGQLARLPHTVGVITDLDPATAARALRSLRAEVRRREQVLAELGVADLAAAQRSAAARGAPDGAPPALVVVVDEFAALARELPAFVDGLVDVAQRGRSLGVHLVLATQRPAGVVSESIRANTALRIALRVADEHESRDVVEVGDAATIPRDRPGRAVLRCGSDAPREVQVASCSASPTGVERVRSWALGARPPELPGGDDPAAVSRLVALVASAAGRSGRPVPARPWIEPLPERCVAHELPAATGTRFAVGWVDRPDEQRRDPLWLDLSHHGGVLVLGASGSGRTTTLRTIVEQLGPRAGGSPDGWGAAGPTWVHAIDSGSGLDGLRGWSHVGDVIGVDDHERVLRLLRATHAELLLRSGRAGASVRPGDEPAPRRVLVVDGLGVFDEVASRVNRGEAIDLLERVARDGRRVGIHVVVATPRRADVSPSLAAALGWQLALRSAHADDALLLGLDAASAHPDVPPGRGHVFGELVQIAVPGTPTHRPTDTTDPTQRADGRPHAIGRLPRRLERTSLQPDLAAPSESSAVTDDPWSALALGLDADQLQTATLDLRHDHVVIAGPPRSGRTTALATLAAALHEAAGRCDQPVAVVQLDLSRPEHDASHVETALRRAVEVASGGAATLVTIDHVTRLAELPSYAAVDEAALALLDAARSLPVRLAVAGDVDELCRCHLDVVTRLRSGRTGIVLRTDGDLHGSVLHTDLPRRDELPRADGRGWLVQRDRLVPLQLALP